MRLEGLTAKVALTSTHRLRTIAAELIKLMTVAQPNGSGRSVFDDDDDDDDVDDDCYY